MKAVFKLRVYVCGVLMLCTAMGSVAMTLGRAQGAIFVGKPLDLRVQLQADADEELQAACMGAEVFYGETLVDPSRVSVSIDTAPGDAGTAPTARVMASAVINEPIVTVNFRAGCQQKSSRRYTLFPEVATNVVGPATRPVAPKSVVPDARSAMPDVVLPVVGATVAPVVASKAERIPARAAKPTTRPAPVATTPPLTPPREKAAAKAATTKASGKSRLKLDPLDLLVERDPVLQATPELLTLPQENAALRAQAAALWRSLNASPEELLLEDAKSKSLERDLKSLYAVTADNQKGLMDLVGRVQQAESERYANGLVYSLAAVCLSLLVALALVWRHFRSASPGNWMQGADEAHDSLLTELVKSPPVDRPTAPARLTPTSDTLDGASTLVRPSPVRPTPIRPDPIEAPAEATSPTESFTTLDFDLDAFAPHPEPTQPLPKTLHSVSGGLRAIDSAELRDVRQQADFFLALGEHQKAIDVLTTRIAQVGESSPLVCLDLLKIYHKLGRESEFEFMRQEFNNWFTGRVPVIDDFGNEGRSLEKYPKVIDQIVALWPDPRVLEYIENCIYHHSTDVYEPDFDLLAYRELLLLHGIAKRFVRLSDDGGDSHAAGLVRIAARAPSGAPVDLEGGGEVAHRMGAEHRGAWKRNLAQDAQATDPEANLDTRGAPLAAMRLPPLPLVERGQNDMVLNPDDEGDAPEGGAGFDFLSLR